MLTLHLVLVDQAHPDAIGRGVELAIPSVTERIVHRIHESPTLQRLLHAIRNLTDYRNAVPLIRLLLLAAEQTRARSGGARR